MEHEICNLWSRFSGNSGPLSSECPSLQRFQSEGGDLNITEQPSRGPKTPSSLASGVALGGGVVAHHLLGPPQPWNGADNVNPVTWRHCYREGNLCTLDAEMDLSELEDVRKFSESPEKSTEPEQTRAVVLNDLRDRRFVTANTNFWEEKEYAHGKTVGTSLVVWGLRLRLPTQWMWVQSLGSLFGELRSCVCLTAKKPKHKAEVIL